MVAERASINRTTDRTTFTYSQSRVSTACVFVLSCLSVFFSYHFLLNSLTSGLVPCDRIFFFSIFLCCAVLPICCFLSVHLSLMFLFLVCATLLWIKLIELNRIIAAGYSSVLGRTLDIPNDIILYYRRPLADIILKYMCDIKNIVGLFFTNV